MAATCNTSENSSITKTEVDAILSDGVLPQNWIPTSSKITHGILKDCFDALDTLGLPQSRIIDICAILLDSSDNNVSSLIEKPSNLRKSVERSLMKNEANKNLVFDRFYPDPELVQPLEVVDVSLARRGVSFDLLRLILEGKTLPIDFNHFNFNNADILDLLAAKEKLAVDWNDFRQWIIDLSLTDKKDQVLGNKNLRLNALQCKKKYTELKQHQKTYEMSTFLEKQFELYNKRSTPENIPELQISHEESQSPNHESMIQEQANYIQDLLLKLSNFEKSLEYLVDEIRSIKEENLKMTVENKNLKDKFHAAKEEMKANSLKLNNAISTISEFKVKNVRRRINRLNKKVKDEETTKEQQSQVIKEQEEIIASLTCHTLENLEENKQYEKQIADLNNSLDKALTNKLREQKMKWYYKDRKVKEHDQKKALLDEEAHCSKIKELNATIRELENEKEEILEKLNVFMKGEDV